MAMHVGVQVALLVLLLAGESASYQRSRGNTQAETVKRLAVGSWGQPDEDLTTIDGDIFPDYWELHTGLLLEVDPRVASNGAEPPEQLVKVTDRKHKFPVFATMCSLAFLATVITLLIVCTS